MRNRRPIRLLICLPLIAVMGLWAFSIGRVSNWSFDIGSAHVGLFSDDGKEIVDAAAHVTSIPYWGVWLAVAGLTIVVQSRFRTPPHTLARK